MDAFNEAFTDVSTLKINASIVKHRNKIFCVHREQHLYGYDGKCTLTELSKNFEILNQKKLKATNNNPAFEDARLFSVGDLLLAFYTYLPKLGRKWHWEFGVGFGIIDVDKGEITHQISLRRLSEKPQNKNWIPYYFGGELFLITDFHPKVRIIKISDQNGKIVFKEYHLGEHETITWPFGDIRGGTPLICQSGANNKWLYGFVHSHLLNHNGFARYYFYTVVRLDPVTKEMQYYKKPLGEANDEINSELIELWKKSTNGKLKVVFPIGIMNHLDGVIVSFGIDDIRSTVKFFKWKYLEGLFDSPQKEESNGS